MTGRHHTMPFGAEPCAGGVRFRLWAPQAQQVALLLGEEEVAGLPMTAVAEGFFELTVAAAGPGSRYRFKVDGGLALPDPASRFQPEDVHRASEVIDPQAFPWEDGDWRGRPWREAVIYELHVGSFTPGGRFVDVIEKLDHLVQLGITAIELMPVADFPGSRNWGYDGVLPFAPESGYGRPEDLKLLVQAAHARGLMVLLDVVYNHFGPEGNYLHLSAPCFFSRRHRTPWGAAVNFDGEGSFWVRRFFIENALYWLAEFHFDGLRIDAVHAIFDDSRPDIIEAIAEAVRARFPDRDLHLVLENDRNSARYLARDAAGGPLRCDAQWNDDLHHALHLLATGEGGGYYHDYAERPAWHLGRALAEGFAWQGEPSPYRDGAPRGEPSHQLPPTAFVSFLQNHDQIGNRAFGERLQLLAEPPALRALTAILLLAPQTPLLFMGQEWGARDPFLYFCDFGPELARAVSEGRRREFARFAQFADPAARARIPDPEDPRTFLRSRLTWADLGSAEGQRWLELHQHLLTIRRERILPLLPAITGGRFELPAERAVSVYWSLADGGSLHLLANLSPLPARCPQPIGEPVYLSASLGDTTPPWSVLVTRIASNAPVHP